MAHHKVLEQHVQSLQPIESKGENLSLASLMPDQKERKSGMAVSGFEDSQAVSDWEHSEDEQEASHIDKNKDLEFLLYLQNKKKNLERERVRKAAYESTGFIDEKNPAAPVEFKKIVKEESREYVKYLSEYSELQAEIDDLNAKIAGLIEEVREIEKEFSKEFFRLINAEEEKPGYVFLPEDLAKDAKIQDADAYNDYYGCKKEINDLETKKQILIIKKTKAKEQLELAKSERKAALEPEPEPETDPGTDSDDFTPDSDSSLDQTTNYANFKPKPLLEFLAKELRIFTKEGHHDTARNIQNKIDEIKAKDSKKEDEKRANIVEKIKEKMKLRKEFEARLCTEQLEKQIEEEQEFEFDSKELKQNTKTFSEKKEWKSGDEKTNHLYMDVLDVVKNGEKFEVVEKKMKLLFESIKENHFLSSTMMERRDERGKTLAHYAMNWDAATFLMEIYADLHTKRDNDGRTPAMCAAASGNAEVFEAYLDYGFSCSWQDKAGNNLLHLITSPAVLKKLIPFDSDRDCERIFHALHVRNHQGLTPIDVAKNHSLELLNAFLAFQTKLESKLGMKAKEIRLVFAIKNGSVSSVKKMLNHMSQSEYFVDWLELTRDKNPNDNSLMHLARTPEMVSVLVQYGLGDHIEAKDSMGRCPIMLAAAEGNIPLFKKFLQLHKNVFDLRDNLGRNLLHFVTHPDMVALLVNRVEHVRFRNRRGLFTDKICNGQLMTMNIHSIINAPDAYGITAVKQAKNQGNEVLFRTLTQIKRHASKAKHQVCEAKAQPKSLGLS
jgi:ankyrin repeat protein